MQGSPRIGWLTMRRSLRPGLARPSGFFAFGEAVQPVRIAQNDPLPASLDQSLLLPRAENPADGVQRRPGHLGDVLPADGKIDLDAGIDLPSGLFGQAEQRMRDALLDLLVRHLQDAGLWILQAAADGLQRA